jgi:hypothetical protein
VYEKERPRERKRQRDREIVSRGREKVEGGREKELLQVFLTEQFGRINCY